MRRIALALWVVVAILALQATGVPASSSPVDPNYFLIKRLGAHTEGNGVLVRQNPGCILTAAHVVGFEGEFINIFDSAGQFFSGKVIKRSLVGPRTKPGDQIGLALIKIGAAKGRLSSAIPIPKSYVYVKDEPLRVLAIMEEYPMGIPVFEIRDARLKLYWPDTYEMEAIDEFRPPHYADWLTVLAAQETGGDSVVPGFSGAAVRNHDGMLVGIVQGIVSAFNLNLVIFTPQPLILKFLANTPCANN